MNKSGFFKIKDVIKFIEEVFGENRSFEIAGGDEIIRSEGRRSEDTVATRTFLEQRSADIVFSLTFIDMAGSGAPSNLPDIFSNPDYPKVLRNRYREINRTEIQYWKIDCNISKLTDTTSQRQEIVVRFTVRYGGEN